jgi:hypothetical protein
MALRFTPAAVIQTLNIGPEANASVTKQTECCRHLFCLLVNKKCLQIARMTTMAYVWRFLEWTQSVLLCLSKIVKTSNVQHT